VLLLFTLPAAGQSSNQDQSAKNGNSVQQNYQAKPNITDGITIVTLPGQNTNGEDLICAIYEAFGNNGGAGGIDCNWTPGHMARHKK
jgi:hypothetical protein